MAGGVALTQMTDAAASPGRRLGLGVQDPGHEAAGQRQGRQISTYLAGSS